MSKRKFKKKICKLCKKEYQPSGARQNYCSESCLKISKRRRKHETAKYIENIKIDQYYLRRGDPNKLRKGSVFLLD